VKKELSMGLITVIAIVAALLAAHGPSVRAQAVASIALPPPGGTVQLYPWCTNIALTFPDGTPSQDVVQAVTPADSVRSMWRHHGSLNKWEGFSPAQPQPPVSDLLSVDFLDAVWICGTGGGGGAGGGSGSGGGGGGTSPGGGGTSPGGGQPAPTPTPTSTPLPPAPPGTQADLAVTDLFPQNLPAGPVSLRVTNNGPDAVTNATVGLSCSENVTPFSGLPYGHGVGSSINVTLNPGQTAEFPSGLSIDTSQGTYEVTCEITMPPGWSGDNPGNNSFTETYNPAPPPGGGSWGILTADMAVTDIYPDNWPNGKLIARVMNFGPDTVSGVTLELGCSYVRHEYLPPHSTTTIAVAPALITPNISKGQTLEYNVHINVEGTKYWYDVTCNISVPFNDPNTTNNSYNEVFPPPP
jgi:hypothetical protein